MEARGSPNPKASARVAAVVLGKLTAFCAVLPRVAVEVPDRFSPLIS